MRVGFVSGEYPPMQGGVGAFTREVARAMADMGHAVHVFTRRQVQGADEEGIAVSPVVGKRWGWHTTRAIRTWAAEKQVDVINIQFQTAAYDMHPAIHWLPQRLSEVPVFVTFHDLRVPYLFPKAGAVRPWIVRKLARDADGVIATDRADEVTLREVWRIAGVRWIPIGSNITTTPPAGYDREAWRSDMGVRQGELLISYFGFLNESKGGLVLVEALAKLVGEGLGAKLAMIGGRAGASDPTNVRYGERVDSLIKQHNLGDRVTWTGFVDDEQVSAYFYASDLTALPYLDGVSLRRGTLMAALAHARAIVTTHPQTDAPELAGVVESVPPNNADALADAILKVWRDTAYRHSLEQAARQANEHFSWAGIAQRTVEYFQDVINR